jgi:hypothetical protein
VRRAVLCANHLLDTFVQHIRLKYGPSPSHKCKRIKMH